MRTKRKNNFKNLGYINKPENITCLIRQTEDKNIITVQFVDMFVSLDIFDAMPIEMELGEEDINKAFNSLNKEIDIILAQAALDKVCENFEHTVSECRNMGLKEWCEKNEESKSVSEDTDEGHLLDVANNFLNELRNVDVSRIKVIYKRHHESLSAGLHMKKVITGISDLDNSWGELQRGQTYFIGSAKGMGKTAFALNLIKNIAVDNKGSMIYFAAKSPSKNVFDRFADYYSGIATDAQQFVDMWKSIRRHVLFTDVKGNIVDSIESSCRYLMAKNNGIDLVIIDDFQTLLSNENEKSHVCSEISFLAQKYNCVFIVLSDLSNEIGIRENHRPTIDDLTEPGLQKEFDNISFIYRDEYYDSETDEKSIVEFDLIKTKDNRLGKVFLAWIPEFQIFSSINRLQDYTDNIEKL